MIKIGQFNFLKIVQKSARGTLFSAGSHGQVFLPKALTPAHCEVGDKIEVFVYRDSHNDLVGTTKKPKVEMGGVACLRVVSVGPVGAFLDWGMPKDLFVPFGEQSKKMQVGEHHIVSVYEDNTQRICATSKLNKFVKPEAEDLKVGQPVNLIVGDKTDLGYKMIVNQKFWGVLHHNDVFRELRYGQRLKGFVKHIRRDKRIDIALKQQGFSQSPSLAAKILAKITEENGYLPISDKSPPKVIYEIFGVSKKVFKAELGNLYRQKKILIEKLGVRLVK